MKKHLVLVVLAVVAIGAASAVASRPVGHQHYASFGPWCVSKHTGVMRAVRGTQPCKPGEVRIGHKRIPLDPVPGPRGLRGLPGAKGDAGTDGASGATGATGLAGTPGAVGPKGETGAPGAAGADGATGPAGPKGDTGPSGAVPGHLVAFCVSHGGNVKYGHCDPGHGDTVEVYGP